MLRKSLHVIYASHLRWVTAIVCFVFVLWGLIVGSNLSAATVPPGFTESAISGPWPDAVGLTFESNGRMYVWERTGRVWIKDPGDTPTLLLNISEEVGAWQDHGMLGFALDPNFRVNGYIYLLYVVDRYYLLNFGTPGYDPNANAYFDATIGRLTRYTCQSSDDFRSIDPASRLILIGETKQTGFPVCAITHGIGSLAFGEDGTLLVSDGDGASPNITDQGGDLPGSFAAQALADSILAAKENIGALRSLLVDSLNGKVLRIDPATGDGLPSNPYYDANNPRSARSRVWALGLRNPCRMSLRPNTGSHFPGDGNPGVIYIGNVGWNTWESLKVATGPGQNFGWPIYEGLDVLGGDGYNGEVANLDAPNPLYPAAGCGQYFTFADLLKEDTLEPAGQPPFDNPCNSSEKIPSSIPQFLHTRPVLDWNHSSAMTRTPTYGGSGQAQTAVVGANGSPVSGTQFQGNCAIGGTWYTGTNFPAAYQDRYYFADWGQRVIKTLTFDANDKPVALGDFASNAGSVVSIVQHPTDGSLYYIGYNYSGATIQRLSYTGNRTPIAVASANQYYGPTPLEVQLSSVGSSDPDGQPITYSWNFGDGSPVSTEANPSHSFSAPAGVPTKYVVTLTVTDSGQLSAQATLIIAVNDTPPNVMITSPIDGSLYSPSTATTANLTATVSDAESSDSQLLYQWQVLLHHNDHNHGSPVDTNHVTTAVIEPTGCDGINIYYYRILLTVTDPTGLSTLHEVRLYPNCGPNTPPTISAIADQNILETQATGPLNFTVGDAEVAAANLQLSVSSSNLVLVPTGNIVLGGGAANRTVTVTPAAGQTGSATITVTVNDGPNNVSTNFVVTVSPSVTVTNSFENATEIIIPSSGPGSLYPSTIAVSGMNGMVSNVTVTLRNLSHTWVSDIDLLLVGPGEQKVLIFSGVGDAFDANNVTVTLSDAAASALPASGPFANGTYKPTSYSISSPNFPSPAPAGPYATALSAFNGTGANGTWSLYVFDHAPGDEGSLAGGWSLTVTTVAASGGSTPTPPPTTPTPTATAMATATPFATATATPTGTAMGTATIAPTPAPTPPSTPAPTPTPAPGLVAAYNFNEGSGTTVADASGHGLTGTVQGATWTTGGRYGNALNFNGSSSYVDLGNPSLLQLTGSMTWSAWMNAASDPADDGQIIAKSNDTSGWQFKTSPDTGQHTFGVAVSGGANAFAQRYSTTVRSLNVWYHVAGVYDAAAGTLDIYVNGVLDNGVLIGTIPGSQVNSAVNVNIGRRTGGYYFSGTIDDVRIYNRALSQTEIQADMNTPIGTLSPTPTPTVPTPTPTSTPTPTPIPTSTPTPTLTPIPINISGTISYCSNPVPGPVPNVTLNLAGDATTSVITDGSGNYQFSFLTAGGNYTVTPAKATLIPGSAGINTVDAIGTQRHFLNLGTPLSGCRLTAADVNGDNAVSTVDVIAIQRFFLGYQTGIANTGKYKFSPVSRSYPALVNEQTAQNYDALVFGDVASPFAGGN